MTKGNFLNLLIPTSHIVHAKLEGVRLHTTRRLRKNFNTLLPLYNEKQELEKEIKEKGLNQEEAKRELEIWENEEFAQAKEIFFFSEDHFDNVANEEVNGRMLDGWVDLLCTAQDQLKPVE